MATKKVGKGSVMQIWSDRCPQGYRCRCHGDGSRILVDMEGITLALVSRKQESAEAASG